MERSSWACDMRCSLACEASKAAQRIVPYLGSLPRPTSSFSEVAPTPKKSTCPKIALLSGMSAISSTSSQTRTVDPDQPCSIPPLTRWMPHSQHLDRLLGRIFAFDQYQAVLREQSFSRFLPEAQNPRSFSFFAYSR
jgi:hypothetical protein